jgi:TolB protein
MRISKSKRKALLIVFSILIISGLILAACGADGEGLLGAAGGEKGKPDKEDKEDKDTGKPDKEDKPSGGGATKKAESTKESGVGHIPVPICHATGSKTNPYVFIIVDRAGEIDGHQKHKGDIINPPDGKCPTPTPPPPDEIPVCHAIDADNNEWELVWVKNEGSLEGHANHPDDKIGANALPCGEPEIVIEPTVNACVQFIVFHTFRDGDLEVYSLFNGAEDSTNAQLYNLSLSSTSEDSRPTRSPNDQYVVFESNRDGNVELYLTDPYGSFQTPLTDSDSNNINPMFLADNRTVVFQSDRNGNWDIFKIDIFTGVETQLTTDINDDIFPFASPDPNWVVFQSNRLGNEDLFLLNVFTGEEFQLTDDVTDELFPAWSANGDQIAYLSNEGGDLALYVVDYDGENKQMIAGSSGINIGNHSWSPEGFRIAYQSEEGGNVDIFTYDFESGEYYQLTDFAGADSSPTWDCGGTMVSFTTVRDGNPNVYQVDWQGLDDESYLTNHPATDKWSEWSPSKEHGSRGW